MRTRFGLLAVALCTVALLVVLCWLFRDPAHRRGSGRRATGSSCAESIGESGCRFLEYTKSQTWGGVDSLVVLCPNGKHDVETVAGWTVAVSSK